MHKWSKLCYVQYLVSTAVIIFTTGDSCASIIMITTDLLPPLTYAIFDHIDIYMVFCLQPVYLPMDLLTNIRVFCSFISYRLDTTFWGIEGIYIYCIAEECFRNRRRTYVMYTFFIILTHLLVWNVISHFFLSAQEKRLVNCFPCWFWHLRSGTMLAVFFLLLSGLFKR